MVSIPFHDFYDYALSFIFSRSWQAPIENGARSEMTKGWLQWVLSIELDLCIVC
jgi:hypothetical protein